MSPVIVAVVPGLAHLFEHHHPGEALERLRRIGACVSQADVVSGDLLDGVWAMPRSHAHALELGLALAAAGAAVGVEVGAWDLQEVPRGAAPLRAAESARLCRGGEVVVPRVWLDRVQAPPGVGSFQAPEALSDPARPRVVLRDYRRF